MSEIGHNEKTPQELHEEQVFFNEFKNVTDLNSDMAGTKGDIGAAYKRAKDCGWSKADFKFAQTLKDKDVSEVIADFEKKIRIAKMFGHQVGRQMDMLNEDRTPIAERAYSEGLAAGKLRSTNSNPYDMSTDAGQAWQRGFNDGSAFIDQDLNEVINGSD